MNVDAGTLGLLGVIVVQTAGVSFFLGRLSEKVAAHREQLQATDERLGALESGASTSVRDDATFELRLKMLDGIPEAMIQLREQIARSDAAAQTERRGLKEKVDAMERNWSNATRQIATLAAKVLPARDQPHD